MLRTAFFQKGRETADGRARQISQPGVNIEDAKRHQAISGPGVSMIQKFHLLCFNHRNFKGCTFTGKGLRVARCVAACGEDYVVIGFDKSSNDRTWTWRKWCELRLTSLRWRKQSATAIFMTSSQA